MFLINSSLIYLKLALTTARCLFFSTFSLSVARRPSGIPEQDLCSYLMPYYQKQEAYMRRELKKIQAENAALAQRVQAGRENIAQTEQRISTTVNELKVRRNTRTIECNHKKSKKNVLCLQNMHSKSQKKSYLFVVCSGCFISVCVLKLICFDKLSLEMCFKTEFYVKR